MANAILEKKGKNNASFCYTLFFHMQVHFLKMVPPKTFSCLQYGYNCCKYNTLTISFLTEKVKTF